MQSVSRSLPSIRYAQGWAPSCVPRPPPRRKMLTLWAMFWFVGSRTRGVVDEEAVDAVGDSSVGSRHEVAVGVHGDADGAVA